MFKFRSRRLEGVETPKQLGDDRTSSHDIGYYTSSYEKLAELMAKQNKDRCFDPEVIGVKTMTMKEFSELSYKEAQRVINDGYKIVY